MPEVGMPSMQRRTVSAVRGKGSSPAVSSREITRFYRQLTNRAGGNRRAIDPSAWRRFVRVFEPLPPPVPPGPRPWKRP